MGWEKVHGGKPKLKIACLRADRSKPTARGQHTSLTYTCAMRLISARPHGGSGWFATAKGIKLSSLSPLTPSIRTVICDVSAQGSGDPVRIASSQMIMSDLARRRQELDEEVRRIAQNLQLLRRQGHRAGRLKVTAGQRSMARVLMAMRHGEPTAAMVSLTSEHKGEPTAAASWVYVGAKLQVWWARRTLQEAGWLRRRFGVDEERNRQDARHCMQRWRRRRGGADGGKIPPSKP